MPKTADRLTLFTESVIREMTRVANQTNAINLSQGFPDADPPPEVLAAGKKAMADGPTNMRSPGGRRVSDRPW
jgi:aspartate/methionine/tyrosine aminotransferase